MPGEDYEFYQLALEVSEILIHKILNSLSLLYIHSDVREVNILQNHMEICF